MASPLVSFFTHLVEQQNMSVQLVSGVHLEPPQTQDLAASPFVQRSLQCVCTWSFVFLHKSFFVRLCSLAVLGITPFTHLQLLVYAFIFFFLKKRFFWWISPNDCGWNREEERSFHALELQNLHSETAQEDRCINHTEFKACTWFRSMLILQKQKSTLNPVFLLLNLCFATWRTLSLEFIRWFKSFLLWLCSKWILSLPWINSLVALEPMNKKREI